MHKIDGVIFQPRFSHLGVSFQVGKNKTKQKTIGGTNQVSCFLVTILLYKIKFARFDSLPEDEIVLQALRILNCNQSGVKLRTVDLITDKARFGPF